MLPMFVCVCVAVCVVAAAVVAKPARAEMRGSG